MKYKVDSKICNRDVVTIYGEMIEKGDFELMKQMTNPNSLSNKVSDNAILNLCTRIGYSALLLGTP